MTERGEAKWEEEPEHPAYECPPGQVSEPASAWRGAELGR